MLRASTTNLIIATGLTLSVCVPSGWAQSLNSDASSPLMDGARLIAEGDAKQSKDSKDAKTKDEKDSKDSRKDSKDEKDAKADGKEKADAKDEEIKDPVIANVANVTPDELIDKPKEFLGKNVRFTAYFSMFCTLALDYKPAFRDKKKYISFLVKKPDSKVPLSEIKLALLIPKETDKPRNKLLTSLREDDKIEVTGKVFSTALDEPWVDVLALKRLQEAKKTDDDSSDDGVE